MNNVVVYTDGAFSSNRQTMGYAFVVLKNDKKVYSWFNGEKGGTNNRAEILSAIFAIEYLKGLDIKDFTLYSDSMYLVGTLTLDWKRNKNLDLWDRIDKIKEGLNVIFKHCKGHEGNKFNNLCDTLAVEGSHINFEENE